MNSLLILIPLAIVVVTVVWGVIHSLTQAWLDYRLKMALLDKLEKHPDMIDSAGRFETALAESGRAPSSPKQNYALTGAILTGIGVVCVVLGRTVRVGQIAVGAYLGGVVCVVLGILLTVLGFVIRALSKDPVASLTDR
ncbi:MAG: hypothetical protein JXR94_23070 [Candidatus Hydrogenedentes bacterium]|nr:hypothetical protein [Candidatus Hydrogenedentota bacterium]